MLAIYQIKNHVIISLPTPFQPTHPQTIKLFPSMFDS